MIVVVGLSHHLSDINMRERVALQGDALKQAYEDAASSGVINEVIWWSTCARTECIAVGHPDQIKQWFIHYFKLSSTSEDQIYQYTADVACCYWLRVACGLDSKIMGEPQILGQLKRAFEQARAQGTLGSVLSFWAPTILKEAKRIRAVTGLTATTASLPAMTKRIAHRIFESTESFSVTDPNKAPTSTVEPSFEFILFKMPVTGEGTSKFTLSVSNSTKGSSASTASPSFFNHLETVASVILSPRTGTKIFSLINNYSKTFLIISCC